jgi:hypothetical protein
LAGVCLEPSLGQLVQGALHPCHPEHQSFSK